MRIEHSAIVPIDETENPAQFLEILTPHDELGIDTELLNLYASQRSWWEEKPATIEHKKIEVILAIGIPDQGETLGGALRKIKTDGWHPASLVHWEASRKFRGYKFNQIAILGTICHDDDFHEWAFTIIHKKIIGVSFKYELSAMALEHLKRMKVPVLLIHIPHKKT